jgi:hypothetical protein
VTDGGLAGRLLSGAELTADEIERYGLVPVVTLSLSIGAWL